MARGPLLDQRSGSLAGEKEGPNDVRWSEASSANVARFGHFRGHTNFLEKYPNLADIPKDAPWLLHYEARCAPNMTNDDSNDVIMTMLRKAMIAVHARHMIAVDNLVIAFVATYPFWLEDSRGLWQIPEAVKLARRALTLGWHCLWGTSGMLGCEDHLVSDRRQQAPH